MSHDLDCSHSHVFYPVSITSSGSLVSQISQQQHWCSEAHKGMASWDNDKMIGWNIRLGNIRLQEKPNFWRINQEVIGGQISEPLDNLRQTIAIWLKGGKK